MAASEEDKGSIMSILATDLPLTSRQLKRILKRTGVGIARTGGYTGHGSGEVMIGFTTANRIPSGREEELLQISAIPEHMINRAFLAAAEAEQEASCSASAAARKARLIICSGIADIWSSSSSRPDGIRFAVVKPIMTSPLPCPV